MGKEPERQNKKVWRQTEPSMSGSYSQRCCNNICQFFLGESAKVPGMGLCSNPNYIKFHEACLAAIGAECNYCTTDDSDLVDLRYISFDHMGQEQRQVSRNLIYNSMLLGITRGTKIIEYPSVILDISLEGIGCIVPVIIESFPQEFYLIKKSSSGEMIKLICQTRRVIKHSTVTEIGASFKEHISEELLALLLKTS